MIENNNIKIKLLINSELDLFHLNSFANVSVDRRNFLSEGSEACASPISEYDLVILDNTMQKARISVIRKDQLLNHIKGGKPFIFVLRQFMGTGEKSNYTILSTIFERNFIFNTREIGQVYSLTTLGKQSCFKSYLEGEKTHYKISLKSEQKDSVLSYANNSEGNCVAFVLKEFRNCYFVPWNNDKAEIFCEIIVKLARESLMNGEPVKEWVKNYSFSHLKKVTKDIIQIEDKISILEQEKLSEISKRENYERIRDTLLYRAGKILEDVTKEVLRELGIEARDGTIGKEDTQFIYDEKHYISEIKGSIGSCQKNNHVGQLKNHMSEYETDNIVKVKGILIMNAWRELPLEDRDKTDTKVFPQESVNVAIISNIVLMTTQQLFVAYCDNLEGKFNLEEFISKVDSTSGILVGYADISEYKI